LCLNSVIQTNKSLDQPQLDVKIFKNITTYCGFHKKCCFCLINAMKANKIRGILMLKAVPSDSNQLESEENQIPFQSVSMDIWDKKYRLKSKQGTFVDNDIEDTYNRVAKALAEVEIPEKRDLWHERFVWALQRGAIPAGRITSNAGALEHKPATSTINCTVSGIIEDSMTDILDKVKEAGLTLKAGCGIGYEYSTLRPKGAFVAGAGAYTSGPLSFMDIYDRMCFTVSSAGGRRGAQMATFDIAHPDVTDFIKAKREDGRLRQFNLSCLITKEFMEAVKTDDNWKLAFPITEKEAKEDQIDLKNNEQVVWREWPVNGKYLTELKGKNAGKVACKVYKTLKAKRLWDIIMSSTYDYAEPGFILIDRVNEMNNNWFCENIRATNPCGEQPLPAYGACLLGSINLTKFVKNPFTDKAYFNWDEYKEVVSIFTRMLDNVVEINGLPLQKQRDEIARKRRHGMGYLGLGSSLAMMQMVYGDEKSIKFTEDVSRILAEEGWKAGVDLAKEKGPAPIMEELFEVTPAMLAMRPEMEVDGIKVGDKLPGKILMGRYSRYMQQFPKALQDQIADQGVRFSHHSSIAPTGTISLSLANNASNGIEPSFAHHYSRNVIREGKKSKEKVDVFSFELLAYRHLINQKAMPFSEKEDEMLPSYFIDSSTIQAKAHVDIQAAAQKWIDSSISKTINVPTDYDYEDFKNIYLYAYDKGLKGCTTFRFNPEAFQGVLVTEKDLENTTYKFELDDGAFVEAKGNEDIEYDGEIHSAANLYDALKEGYYGKF